MYVTLYLEQEQRTTEENMVAAPHNTCPRLVHNSETQPKPQNCFLATQFWTDLDLKKKKVKTLE